MSDASFIPPHGNYAELLSYQKAVAVYDLTFRFCGRFLTKGDRTIDQMVQAARSGKAKHCGRVQSLRHLQGDGDQAGKCSPRQP